MFGNLIIRNKGYDSKETYEMGSPLSCITWEWMREEIQKVLGGYYRTQKMVGKEKNNFLIDSWNECTGSNGKNRNKKSAPCIVEDSLLWDDVIDETGVPYG